MSLYTSYLRAVDNPLHDRSNYADCLLPEHVRCFRECFDRMEAYSASLFSDPNLTASARYTFGRIDTFVDVALSNRNPLVIVELCIVMETYVKRSLKYNLSGYLAVALRAYIALLKAARIAATEERTEWKEYQEESRDNGYISHETQGEGHLSAELVAESTREHVQQDQSRSSNKYMRHPPEKYRVMVEMIVRTSCFYSFETLLNSNNLNHIDVAVEALQSFIEVQLEYSHGGRNEEVDFTPLFPVLLSLCRKGFHDREGLFKGHTSENIIRRRGDNGAKRLLETRATTSSRRHTATIAEEHCESVDVSMNSARLRTIGFKMLSQLIEIMFTKMRTTALRKCLESYLDEISRTIFVCLLRMDYEQSMLRQAKEAEKAKESRFNWAKGLSFLDGGYDNDGEPSESEADEKCESECQSDELDDSGKNESGDEGREEAVPSPVTVAAARKRRQKGSVVIHGKVLAIDENGAVIQEEDVVSDSEEVPLTPPEKPLKPPKPDKKGKLTLRHTSDIKKTEEKSKSDDNLALREKKEAEERRKLRAEALHGIEEDIEEEMAAATREELFESAPYAWRCLQYLASIPSVPAVCALTMRFIAAFDDERWVSQDLIVKIFSRIIETASSIPMETSVDQEHDVPLVHARNAPVEHLLLIHAQRLASDYTTLTPMHKYYDGYSDLVTKSGRASHVVPVDVGSEHRARNHLTRLCVLDRVLTVANILLEQALSSPETIKYNLSSNNEATRSPLIEKVHPSTSSRAAGGSSDKQPVILRKRDLSEFFEFNVHALLTVLWQACLWYPCDHFTITEMELPADHHANDSVARMDAEARQHLMSGQQTTVHTSMNDEVTEQIDNCLDHTYAALGLLIRDFRPQSPEQVRAILPQIMYFCTETSAAHSLLEFDDKTGRHGRLTPHLLRFRTVISHAVNVVVAECVERFGDCANDGTSGYWATVSQSPLDTDRAFKPYPHLFTDDCFAHLMIAYRSPDWQVVRQVTVVLLNLLEERLIYGLDAYELSHLGSGATEDQRLSLTFAPLTETQLCMFHDVTFQMLCAFCGEQALILSSVWCVHSSLLQAYGEEEIFLSIPFILALEEYWTNFPKSVKATKPAFRSRCLEMLSCQRLYFLVFWFKVAEFYECGSLRRFCLNLLSSWAGVGKLPKSLNINMYDIELRAVVVEKSALHSKSHVEMDTLSIGSRIDKKELLADLLDSDRAKGHKEALEKAFATPYLPEEPLTRVTTKEGPAHGLDDSSDSDSDDSEHSRAVPYPVRTPARRSKGGRASAKTPRSHHEQVKTWMKNLFGHVEADVGAGGSLYGEVAEDETMQSLQGQGTPHAGLEKGRENMGLRGFFNSPLPTMTIGTSSSSRKGSPGSARDKVARGKQSLLEVGRGFFNSPMPSFRRGDEEERETSSELDSRLDPPETEAETEARDTEESERKRPEYAKVGKIQDSHKHLDNAVASLRELENTLMDEVSTCLDSDRRERLSSDLIKVQGQIAGLEYMLESVILVESSVAESNKCDGIDLAVVSQDGEDNLWSSSFKMKRMDIVNDNVESAMKKARKSIRSVRKSIGAASALAKSMKESALSSFRDSDKTDGQEMIKSEGESSGVGYSAAGGGGSGSASNATLEKDNIDDYATRMETTSVEVSPRVYSRSSKMREYDSEDGSDDAYDDLSSVPYVPTATDTASHIDPSACAPTEIRAAEDCERSNVPRSTKMRPEWEEDEEREDVGSKDPRLTKMREISDSESLSGDGDQTSSLALESFPSDEHECVVTNSSHVVGDSEVSVGTPKGSPTPKTGALTDSPTLMVPPADVISDEELRAGIELAENELESALKQEEKDSPVADEAAGEATTEEATAVEGSLQATNEAC